MNTKKKAKLILENGKIFNGYAFGKIGTTIGEVCFNTGMTGYQEILTDPSYCGQLITMTYPHIGNYGINEDQLLQQIKKNDKMVNYLKDKEIVKKIYVPNRLINLIVR